jgi:flagellar biosynthesis GTPase FlhF
MKAATVGTRTGGREGMKKRGFAPALLVALAIVTVFVCVFSTAAHARPDFTWTGMSSVTENWSSLENWEGGVAPERSMAIGTLTFPRLTSTACTVEEEEHPCYISFNDLTGLSAESIQIDDGDGYLIGGETLALGGGGITASPASGANGPGDLLLMPLELTTSQRWTISQRSDGALDENGLLLAGEITGMGSALTVEQSNASALIFAKNKVEVGPVTITGSSPSARADANGSVFFENGELNDEDGQPVSLSDIFFAGTGALGPLSTNGVTLVVGLYKAPAEGLEAASVKLDPGSGLLFQIVGNGTVAQDDYSQLTSPGRVELAGLIIATPVRTSSKAPCPTLAEGSTYTFVSTTGTLTGSFSNAPEGGPEVPIFFEEGCHKPMQTMRITYNRTGSVKTVVGTIEAAAEEKQKAAENEAKKNEEEAKTKKRDEEEAKKQQEAEANRKKTQEAIAGELKKVAEEIKQEAEAAAKKHEAEIAANHPHPEESVAKGGVLAAKETARPKSPTRAQLLAKALKACRKQPTKHRLAQCEAQARRKYGSAGRGRKGHKKK